MPELTSSLLSALAPEVSGRLRAALAEARGADGHDAWRAVVDALRAGEAHFQALVEHVPVVIYVAAFDEEATLRYVSPRIEELTGLRADELVGNDDSWYSCVHHDDVDRVREAEATSFREGSEFDCGYRMVHRDGTVRHVWERDVVVRDETGAPLFTQGIVLDVTPLRTTQAAVRVERDRAQRYLDVASVTLMALDLDGRVTMLNRAGHALFGYEDGELIGADYFATCLPDDSRDRLRAAFSTRMAADDIDAEAEIEVRSRDGSVRAVIWRTNVLRENGRPVGLLCSGTDITASREAQQQIAHMAYHDSLTGLPNRAMLRDHLDLALARATRNGHSVALLYIDLDDFKLVNDGLGHAAGDDLLRTMADRLRARLREQDLLAREGGDEFLVLLADLDDDAEMRALTVAESLVDALHAPLQLSGTEFDVNGSVGISVFPRDAPDAEGLLAHADSAMYEAKAAGRGQVRVFRGRRQRSSERLSLGRRLRRAIEEHELVLHWQPIIALETGLLKGAEALVRWQDPQRGLIAAGQFVYDMEAAGLLEQLDEWVGLAFAAQRRAWQAQGLDPFVGFNLGPRALSTARVERMLDCLGSPEADLHRVTIEISESEILRDDAVVREALHRLHAAGITLALDDFGVAYSSLSRLRDLPTTWIKIDRSFLVGVPADPVATRILDAILQLLEALESRVIVEGVETAEQVQYLMSHGCEAAQGYFLGRPMPAAELEPMLRASPESHAAIVPASR
ncbi:MAG: hypothetical protein JWM71_286 [Solirubrobacteraceae bacterium]|nr:hypothetical protein [Solirubrobacteraceae bacterium]